MRNVLVLTKGGLREQFLLSFLFMKVDILLVGCGGTGGCFYARMMRFLSNYAERQSSVEIIFRIIDGDHVELKNLSRQPFSDEDLGKNKAVALAASAQEVFGINVKAYPEYLTPDNMNTYLHQNSAVSSKDIYIIIGAVDNHACRKLLHKYFLHPDYLSQSTLFYIDSANEFSCGEIVVGKRTKNSVETPDRVHYYPDILQDTGKAAHEMSCEELNNSAPQHLATNGLAADLIFSYVSQLLMAGEQAHLAPGGIIYFDSMKLFSRFDIYEEKTLSNQSD